MWAQKCAQLPLVGSLGPMGQDIREAAGANARQSKGSLKTQLWVQGHFVGLALSRFFGLWRGIGLGFGGRLTP